MLGYIVTSPLTEHVRGVDVGGVLPSLAASSDGALHGQPRPGGDHHHQRQEDSLLQHPAGSGGQREVRAWYRRLQGWREIKAEGKWPRGLWDELWRGRVLGGQRQKR